jgi:hypothetical protein
MSKNVLLVDVKIPDGSISGTIGPDIGKHPILGHQECPDIGYVVIWILATPISSVRPSISNVTFDIEDFDIVCSFDIDVLHLRYRILISKVFDIEGLTVSLFDIEGHQPLISNANNRITDIEVS